MLCETVLSHAYTQNTQDALKTDGRTACHQEAAESVFCFKRADVTMRPTLILYTVLEDGQTQSKS